jgi:hypothetical protein
MLSWFRDYTSVPATAIWLSELIPIPSPITPRNTRVRYGHTFSTAQILAAHIDSMHPEAKQEIF